MSRNQQLAMFYSIFAATLAGLMLAMWGLDQVSWQTFLHSCLAAGAVAGLMDQERPTLPESLTVSLVIIVFWVTLIFDSYGTHAAEITGPMMMAFAAAAYWGLLRLIALLRLRKFLAAIFMKLRSLFMPVAVFFATLAAAYDSEDGDDEPRSSRRDRENDLSSDWSESDPDSHLDSSDDDSLDYSVVDLDDHKDFGTNAASGYPMVDDFVDAAGNANGWDSSDDWSASSDASGSSWD